MSPVIWKFGQLNKEVRVLSLNPNNDIFNDYRLKFLIKNSKIKPALSNCKKLLFLK